MGINVNKCCILFLVSCLLFLSSADAAKIRKNKPCKTMELYFHDILFNGKNFNNATSSTNVNATGFGNFQFGRMNVIYNLITADQNYSSTPVARAQGFFIYDLPNNLSVFFVYSLVFNSTQNKGTLNVMGADINAKQLSIVGGTGDFFMARGIITLTDDFNDPFVYFRLKMDIKLYECY